MNYAAVRRNVEAIKNNTAKIRQLNLSDSQLSPPFFKKIMEALCYNTSVVYLTLENSDVGTHGAKWLGKMLENNKSINILDLTNTELNNDDVINICKGLKHNKTLSVLVLAQNHFHDAGIQAICDALGTSHLAALDLSYTNSLSDIGVGLLIETLNENKNLKKLNLSNNNLTNAQAVGFIELEINSGLEHLIFSHNNLDIGYLAEKLLTNHTLIDLDFSHNLIGDYGASNLAKVLEKNFNITSLNLKDTDLHPHDLEVIEKALKRNFSLKVLNLHGNNLDPHKVRKLEKFLSERDLDEFNEEQSDQTLELDVNTKNEPSTPKETQKTEKKEVDLDAIEAELDEMEIAPVKKKPALDDFDE